MAHNTDDAKKFTARLPAQTAARMEAFVKRRKRLNPGYSKNQLVLEALNAYIEAIRRKEEQQNG